MEEETNWAVQWARCTMELSGLPITEGQTWQWEQVFQNSRSVKEQGTSSRLRTGWEVGPANFREPKE